MTAAPIVDAHLDPWSPVPLATGETILFGFALHHAETGGLSWMSSSELLELDIPAGRARTRSGRRYQLGRRFDAVDVGGEGPEARAAFELLIGDVADDMARLRNLDALWVSACKAARHLGVAPPDRKVPDITAFSDRNAAAYLALRRRNAGTTS